ncbi:protein kinase domain-containing protein [Nonomuraea polychroma]|uniref:serine/threonine-protein kinase n=1 Tax=Nonomuraea polychroma TaxID=46176 RepID=UPI003D8B56E3
MEWNAPGYTEVKQLGAGASGRVVLAVHDETGVKVAIKYLAADLLGDPAALARFQSEARLLTTLRDPHIATMWEYIQDAGGACIVMELVNGVSLRALLREHGATEPEAALVVLKGSLLGLARAHTLGLVHRDYKPENVMVRDDGISKLVDFGIAVRRGTVARPEGTPPYMAPELWEGRPASPSTDVYAATAVFFECLTGHRPYRSTEPSVLGYQHVHAPVPFHDTPEPVHRLIRRGLAKDPGQRPESALAFVAELEAVATAAYGEDWEERGKRRLAALVALLALLLPTPPPATTPEVSTSLARTVFRGLRSNASSVARVAIGGALAAAVAVAVVVVVANREPTPAGPIGAAAAVPPTELAPEPASAPPTTPEPTPEETPESSPESTPGTDPENTPEAVLPEESPAVSPPASTRPTITPTRTRTPTPTPTTTPTAIPTATATLTPTPTVITPSSATSVFAIGLGDLLVTENGVATTTINVRASGTAAVTATATWAASGTDGRTERVRLAGSTTYTRTLTWSMGERPCGKTITLTVSTSPAAPGGDRTASVTVPPCPTRVTGLRVGLVVPAAPSRVAQARIRVTASGTAEIPVQAEFALNGDPIGTRTANLSGQTSYSRTLTHTFRSRPCGATLSVKVTAGGRTATAQTSVPCPPEPAQVRRVSVLRAGPGDGLTATVQVLTSNTQPVRVTVAFSAGELGDTRSETLSGERSYTRTFTLPVKELPCGTKWSVTASTDPAAANGSDTASGVTPECPSEDGPTKKPRPETSDTPGKVD